MSGLSSAAPVPRRRRAVRRHRRRLQHPAAHQGAPVPEQLCHQQARRNRLAGTVSYSHLYIRGTQVTTSCTLNTHSYYEMRTQ